MQKIAFFMHNFTGGGAEKVTIRLANELEQRGNEVEIIVINNSGVLQNTVNPNVYIRSLDIRNKSKLIKNVKNIIKLKNIIEKDGVDVLISVTTPMNLIASIANSIVRKKIKLFATVHSTMSMEKRTFNSLRHKLIKYFDKFVYKTIVVSKEAEEDYIRTVGVDRLKTTTIYNPIVSDSIFKYEKEKVIHKWLTSDRKFKTILAVGRLSEPKNYEMLLESISNVSKKVDVRLIILGEGELKERLKGLAVNLKIDNIVDFYGFTDNPYVYFYNCDLYVLSSKWEGLPSVLIEALACGCKVVSTDCPTGPKEILNNGEYGKLVPVNNASLLSEAIINSLNEDIDKEKQVARAKEFSVDKSIENYIKVINS